MTENFPIYPDLKGKVALITGIGQVGLTDTTTWGNGAATARLLSHNGVKIFGCDLKLEAAERTKSRLLAEKQDVECEVMACDVTKKDQIQAVVDAIMSKWGRIDILVSEKSLGVIS